MPDDSFFINEELPTGELEINAPDVKDLRVRDYLGDIRSFKTPECVSFDLNLLKWEAFSYNRAIYCQSFEKLTEELSKDEDSMSLNRAKALSSIMTKHFEIIDRASRVFDLNWAVEFVHRNGYAIVPIQEIERVMEGKYDAYHAFRLREE